MENNETDNRVEQFEKEFFSEKVKTMSPREAKVMAFRFGLEDSILHTREETGIQFGITADHVRAIEAKVFRGIHIRRTYSRRLREYLES